MVRPLLALLVAVSLAGCGSTSTSDAPASPAPSAPAGAGLKDATPAQAAAIDAQTKGKASPAGSDVTPGTVIDTFSAQRVTLADDAGDPDYAALTPVLTDEEGNPVPGADAAEEAYGAFTVYVGKDGKRLADIAALDDLVPADLPDPDGIVWKGEEDPTGETVTTAYTFHAGGRVMLAWVGGAKRETTPQFDAVRKLLAPLDG